MTEKLLPEKIVAYQEKPGAYGKWIHTYAAHDLEGFLHATYVRADIATTATVSKEVEDAIKTARSYLDERCPDTGYRTLPTMLTNCMETLITVSKTTAPPYVIASGALNPEDFKDMKPGQVVFASNTPGFTRDELVEAGGKKIQADNGEAVDYQYEYAESVVKALIDMGVVRVREGK